MQKDARHQQLSEFLRSRRARIALSDVGLPSIGRRRTPGLRRAEVAQLAGVGLDWYTWLEQGRNINPSEQVLTSIARILRLNDTETGYLFTLVYGSQPTPRIESVSPIVQSMLDSFTFSPAKVMNHCWDVVAWNQAYCALFGNMEAVPLADRNCLVNAFTDPWLRQILVDWEGYMRDVVAQFRADYGANPSDPYYAEIIDHLLAISPEFSTWWGYHDVRSRDNRRKEYNHPVVGHLVVEKITFQMSQYPDLRVVLQIPVPETPTEERLHQLIEMTNAESILIR
jgi:transcriptional regulator with XRE-family HTH domain